MWNCRLTKEEVLTNEARLSLASCQQALAREKDKYEQAEWRKAELMQQLDETKRELGGKVHQVAERVKEQSTEHCQMIMQLNTMQQEMELKNDLQQRQAMVKCNVNSAITVTVVITPLNNIEYFFK